MDKCTNCNANNQITIAGKTFCANCGTPVDSSSTSAAVSKVDPIKTNQQNPGPVSPLDSLATPPVKPINPIPAEPLVQQPQPTALTPAEQTPAPVGPTPQTAINQDNAASQKPLVTQDEPQSKATSEISSMLQHGQDEASLQKLLEKSKSVRAQVQPQATPTVSRVAPVQPSTGLLSTNNIQPKENVGSELDSLDSKSEAVFSDAQLNELAKATQSGTVIRPSSRTMSDITPTSGPSVEYIPPKTQNTSQQQPVRPATPVQEAMNTSQAPSILPPTTRASAPVTGLQPVPQTHKVVEMGLPTKATPTPQSPAQPKQIPPEKTKTSVFKPASVAMSLVGLVLVGLYVWQINYPNLAFKVASGKAGINASLPNYLPSGWRVAGNIQSSPGVISYSLSNNGNSQQMQVQEARTDWDSQALAENYVSQKSDNYLALQSQGLTIYMYGNNQASWVNNGTWYKIEGNTNSLSQDQLIKIATSL